jgi:hypothetical protein
VTFILNDNRQYHSDARCALWKALTAVSIPFRRINNREQRTKIYRGGFMASWNFATCQAMRELGAP